MEEVGSLVLWMVCDRCCFLRFRYRIPVPSRVCLPAGNTLAAVQAADGERIVGMVVVYVMPRRSLMACTCFAVMDLVGVVSLADRHGSVRGHLQQLAVCTDRW